MTTDTRGDPVWEAAMSKVRAEVIEDCASIAENFCDYTGFGSEDENSLIGMFARGNRSARRKIAAAIRARAREMESK